MRNQCSDGVELHIARSLCNAKKEFLVITWHALISFIAYINTHNHATQVQTRSDHPSPSPWIFKKATNISAKFVGWDNAFISRMLKTFWLLLAYKQFSANWICWPVPHQLLLSNWKCVTIRKRTRLIMWKGFGQGRVRWRWGCGATGRVSLSTAHLGAPCCFPPCYTDSRSRNIHHFPQTPFHPSVGGEGRSQCKISGRMHWAKGFAYPSPSPIVLALGCAEWITELPVYEHLLKMRITPIDFCSITWSKKFI